MANPRDVDMTDVDAYIYIYIYIRKNKLGEYAARAPTSPRPAHLQAPKAGHLPCAGRNAQKMFWKLARQHLQVQANTHT